jgi:mannose-6-phosphate isomerase
LHADPGSLIYAGLKQGVDRAALAEAIETGAAESCLHSFEPKPGDCIFIPAGTVHALGAGLVVAEVQQASDTTFRLYDWNRVDADGNPRPLHIEQGLDATDFCRGPVDAQTPQPTGSPHIDRLVACDKFVLDRWRFSDAQTVGGDQRFHVLAVLDGAVSVEGDPCDEPLVRGQVALLPACVGDVRLDPHGSTTLLDAYLPIDS